MTERMCWILVFVLLLLAFVFSNAGATAAQEMAAQQPYPKRGENTEDGRATLLFPCPKQNTVLTWIVDDKREILAFAQLLSATTDSESQVTRDMGYEFARSMAAINPAFLAPVINLLNACWTPAQGT